jgi:DNA (cytosine-5)-methyltransferase 1
MKNQVKIIELFSGIGGFSKGLADAGFNIIEHYFAEIDKHAIANYKYNFPNAKHIGSVTDISGRDFSGIDIITFGSPCQDFSLAGKREGMDGQRSVLILEAIRLVTELRPSVFIWENVKGAFSSNSGADFWGILQAFANIGGYRLEWQLLNTKWFLPQNRERIYLVGHLAGSERSFGNVFPIGEESELYNKKEQKSSSKNSQESVAKCLNANDEKSWVGNFIETPKIAGCLTGGGNSGGNHSDMTLICDSGKSRQLEERSIMPPLRANTGAGHGNYIKNQNPHVNNIRRLTEIECERLQGFPDDWTKYGNYDGTIKEIPKTQRYKMLGNAVTVKVVEEIGKRLLQ